MTTPGDEQRALLSEGQAALFASLADATPIGIIRYLGEGDPRAVAQITASIGVDRSAVLEHVDALRNNGVLDSHHDTAFTRYDVKDARVFQLLELATEILAARPLSFERSRASDRLPVAYDGLTDADRERARDSRLA